MKITPPLGGLLALLAAVVIAGSVLFSTGGGGKTDTSANGPKPPSSSSGSGSSGSGSSGSGSSGTVTPPNNPTLPFPFPVKPKPTPTPTKTATPKPTPTPTKTATPTPTPTKTSTPTPTPTPTPTTPTPPVKTGPNTVVSLTFDDGDANQLAALPILQSHGMVGTFYVISGYVGAPGYLTQGDLATVHAGGNEIGGHTVTHPDLTTLPTDEVKRQICTDRNTLSGWGYTPTSFAYPFASTNATVDSIAQSCGYNSARNLGDIASRFGCAGCDAAESIPPANAFETKALDQVDSTWTLTDLQTAVLNAEKNGGWLQYTFHNICDNACGDPSISPALLDQFLTWLQAHQATKNTVVKTVGATVGGSVKPLVTPPAPPAPVNGVNGVQNAGFEQGSLCWYQGGYGTNTPTFGMGAPAHTGSSAGQLTMSGYSSGDAKWLQAFDLGGCAPSVTAGHTYSMRTWYEASTVTQFEVYLRSSVGTWSYWTSSPWFASATAWTQAVWTTPQIPAGMTGISFGLNLFGNGTLSTDDYELYDSVGAPAAAVVAPDPSAMALIAPPTTPIDPATTTPLLPAPGASTSSDLTSGAPSDTSGADGTGSPAGGTTSGDGSGSTPAPAPSAPAAPATPPATPAPPAATPVDPPAPAPADPPAPSVAATVAGIVASATTPADTEPAPTP